MGNNKEMKKNAKNTEDGSAKNRYGNSHGVIHDDHKHGGCEQSSGCVRDDAPTGASRGRCGSNH